LVIDTVVCLTLDKWETVSGQFGGYLTRFGSFIEIQVSTAHLNRRLTRLNRAKYLVYWFFSRNEPILIIPFRIENATPKRAAYVCLPQASLLAEYNPFRWVVGSTLQRP
jgi:hypothetical protein